MDERDEARQEAERRIEAWREGEVLDLAISHLDLLPDSITKLSNLSELVFGRPPLSGPM